MPVTLQSRLPLIAAELRPRVSAGVREGAEAVADLARERVPVDSGRLRDSIEVRRSGAAAYRVVAEAQDDTGVPYAHMVEFGTLHSAAQPFLVPAGEAGVEVAEDIISDILKTL